MDCDETQICVTRTLKKDINKPVMKEKDDLLPVSKDCLQQGTKTEEEEEKKFCAAKRHFPLTL